MFVAFKYTAAVGKERFRSGPADDEYPCSSNRISCFHHARVAAVEANRTGGEMREFTHAIQYTGEVFAVSAHATL